MPASMRLISLVTCSLLATPLAVDAKPKPKAAAKVHIDAAAKAHKEGKFDVALSELEAAYAIDPQPKLLFAIAQVHVKLDNCPAAVEHYKKFLATTKDKGAKGVVEEAIAACDSKVAAQPPPPAEPPPSEPSPVEPAPEPTPVPEPEPAPPAPVPAARVDTTVRTTHSPWYTDVVGDALVITGIGAGVASYLVYRGATSDLDAAERAMTLDEYNAGVDKAHDKRTYAVVLAGGGIALLTAGVLRYALRDSTRESTTVTVAPLGDGGGLITWTGGF